MLHAVPTAIINLDPASGQINMKIGACCNTFFGYNKFSFLNPCLSDLELSMNVLIFSCDLAGNHHQYQSGSFQAPNLLSVLSYGLQGLLPILNRTSHHFSSIEISPAPTFLTVDCNSIFHICDLFYYQQPGIFNIVRNVIVCDNNKTSSSGAITLCLPQYHRCCVVL